MKRKEVARYSLYGIVLANYIIFTHQDEIQHQFRTFSVHDGSIVSILSSMFYHADWEHLALNMIALLRYGHGVFVDTSSSTWQSPWCIFTLYLGSGISSSWGVMGLSRLYESQWQRRLKQSRDAASCSYWMCDYVGWNFISRPVADLYTYTFFASEAMALTWYKFVQRIGASGAVYGLLGARLYTSVFSPWHKKLDSVSMVFLVGQISYEFAQSPLSLSGLWENGVSGDGIDHAGHFFGMISGALFAAVLDRFAKWKIWSSGGRRLGGRGPGRG